MQKRSSSLLLGPQIESVPEGDRPPPLVNKEEISEKTDNSMNDEIDNYDTNDAGANRRKENDFSVQIDKTDNYDTNDDQVEANGKKEMDFPVQTNATDNHNIKKDKDSPVHNDRDKMIDHTDKQVLIGSWRVHILRAPITGLVSGTTRPHGQ